LWREAQPVEISTFQEAFPGQHIQITAK